MIPYAHQWNGKPPVLRDHNPFGYLSTNYDHRAAILWEIAEYQDTIRHLYPHYPAAIKIARLMIYIWTLELHKRI